MHQISLQCNQPERAIQKCCFIFKNDRKVSLLYAHRAVREDIHIVSEGMVNATTQWSTSHGSDHQKSVRKLDMKRMVSVIVVRLV